MRKHRGSLFIKYLAIFISVLIVSNIIASVAAFIHLDEIRSFREIISSDRVPMDFAKRMGIFSIIIGSVFSFFAARVVIKPIKKLSEGAKSVASGDFSVQLNISKKERDELGDLMQNFNLMVRELSKNELLHKDFVSNVSHEFKTPITAIQGYAEMLSSPNLNEEKRFEYAQIITNQCARLSKLSSDLLRLSELENEQILIKHETFSLDEQIRDAILLLQNEWEEKAIDLQINLEKIVFSGDRALLYQVWINVIGNAIKYSNHNGRIDISLLRSQEKISIIIRDNGIGMSEEQSTRVFERFYRADSARTNAGTGLGLPIAKRIIILHGGTISVKSKLDHGTTFEIELPVFKNI